MNEAGGLAREMTVDHRSPVPVYAQVMEGVRRLLAEGRLKAGDQLPTVRALAAALDINPNTVARAYRELEREGLLSSRVGRGTFLDADAGAGRSAAVEAFWRQTRERAREAGLTEAELLGFLKKSHGGK